jgi:hypothetical protein
MRPAGRRGRNRTGAHAEIFWLGMFELFKGALEMGRIFQKQSKRGGKRPGAGRPRGSLDKGRVDRREIAVEIALGGLERVLATYAKGDPRTVRDRRCHMALALLGVPARTIAAALKPETSAKFLKDLERALDAVEDGIRRDGEPDHRGGSPRRSQDGGRRPLELEQEGPIDLLDIDPAILDRLEGVG